MNLTKEDLEAISKIVDTSVAQQLGIMKEQYFDPRFQLLADAIGELNDRLEEKADPEEISVTLDAHTAALKDHTRRLRALEKKAI